MGEDQARPVSLYRQLVAHDGIGRVSVAPGELQDLRRLPNKDAARHRVGSAKHQLVAAADMRLDASDAHPGRGARAARRKSGDIGDRS
jgi:hypothetical protein